MSFKEDIKNHKVIIIHPIFKKDQNTHIELKLNEAIGLAKAMNFSIIHSEIVSLNKVSPSTYIGSGKITELKNLISENEIDLLLMDKHISPIQQRNLEKLLNCKVLDRTALIIEIFANRAKTREGSLQVELAALQYQKTRLVRSWTHLERQRGGFGFTGGPGEKQIESDRRNIREQIKKIEIDLLNVKNMRALHRKSRDNVPYNVIALVGYTNAGKTSLFNKLTGSNQYADDKLFATLDPTIRKITLPSKRKVLISDTVGFISDLPTELVAAFSATLEEVVRADIIIHVIDASNHESLTHKIEVEKTLKLLKIDIDSDNIIIINNKLDLITDEVSYDYKNISISTKDEINIDILLNKIEELLSKDEHIEKISLNNKDGKIYSWLHDHSQIIKKFNSDDIINLTIKISSKKKNQLLSMINDQ